MDNLTIITSTGNLSVFENTRSVYLFGEIDDGRGEVNSVINVMDHLSRKSDAPIRLYVHSQGGDAFTAEMVIDAIHRINQVAPVEVIGTGTVMSCALDIVAWGPKGHRWGTPRCKFLAHRPDYELGDGNADAQAAWGYFEKKAEIREIRELATYTGMSFRKLKGRIWKTWIFEVKEAIENGIIDGVWENPKT